MFGGGIQSVITPNREEAIKKAIELIGEDATKCVSLCKFMDIYYVYLKHFIDCCPF
jgi:hypothetical protein